MQPTPHTLSDAERIAKDFKEFAYIVSHDLGTPLRAMVEFSKLLKIENADTLSEDNKLYLSMIVEGGEKIQSMMSELLAYSRLNTLKTHTKLNCIEIIDNCQLLLKDKITASNAKIAFSGLPMITGDAEQIENLFAILIDNSIKFADKNKAPEITISAQLKESDWAFTVQDNGIGIEPEFYERVFLPFQRLHAEKEYPGVGMGLTLAKKIVCLHGGTIGIESSLGQGATFSFTIPI